MIMMKYTDTITKQILIDLGFTPDEDNVLSIQVGNNVSITFDEDLIFGLGLEWRGRGADVWAEVKTVAQLAVIYFYLSGQKFTRIEESREVGNYKGPIK